MPDRFPTLYIPHGGGPCFFIKPEDLPPAMPKDTWHGLEAYLRAIPAQLGRTPRAVVVVSAHWLTPRPTVSTATDHRLLYDYYGFPNYTYHFDYPAKGSPEVAARVVQLLGEAGIACDTDGERGLDHGVFVPFMLIYPDADVPLVPLSLQQDMDAGDHLRIGQALERLRDEDVLIVGSGMSFHNMRAIMTGQLGAEAQAFDDWLTAAATAPDDRAQTRALIAWAGAPGARASHPPGAEEHLIPLMVAAGAAGSDPGTQAFHGSLGNKALSGYQFG